jgi:hypothetical protein
MPFADALGGLRGDDRAVVCLPDSPAMCRIHVCTVSPALDS